MSSAIRYFVLFSVCMVLAGCAPQPSQSKVAVVELSKALSDSGYGAKIDSIINVEKAKFNQQLGALQNQMLQVFNKKKTEYGEKPDDQQKSELASMQNQIGQRLRLASNSANQELGRLSNILVGQFRSKLLSPNVEKIAKEKGFDIVVLQNPDMIAFNKNVNITESVVEAIKSGEAVELKLPENPNIRPPAPKTGTTGSNPLLNPSAPVKKPAEKKEADSKDENKSEDKKEEKDKTAEEKTEKKEASKKKESSKPDTKDEDSKSTKASKEKKEPAKEESKSTDSKAEKKK